MSKAAAIIVGLLFLPGAALGAEMKHIVLIAGSASHGGGEHEHPGSCLLLKSCLETVPGVSAAVYTNGWPGDPYYKNWGNDNFRKVVLNAILWTAKIEVPSAGVSCQVTAEDLKKNLQPKPR